jgi:hypothetical protein
MNLSAIFTSLSLPVLAVLVAAAAPAGDPCGRHRNVVACRADPACYGMPYQGESVVACQLDGRGFASNCPTVGCTSTPPRPAGR